MASAMTNLLLQCCSCEQALNLNSHTLACLCNVCNTCMEENRLTDVEGESDVGKCPKCREIFNVEESDLSPFLATEIKRHLPLECCFCSEQNAVSIGKLWCQKCRQIFCQSCNRVHMKLTKSHICKNLDGVSRSEWIKQVMSENCLLHGKKRNLFCNQCNTCFCDVCYREGEYPSSHSDCVGARVLSVKDEVLRLKSKEGPILEQNVKKFASAVKKSNEKLTRRSSKLNTELDQKCLEIWQNYDKKVDCARRDADELCNKLRGEKDDEESRLHDQLARNAVILSQIEMWLLSCQHLLHEAERNVDILCGLHALKWKVQSWQEKWNRPEKKMDSPPLLAQNVDSSSSSLVPKEIPKLRGLRKLKECNLQKGLEINSIHVTEEDGHIFLCDSTNKSLIELSETGEFLHEFHFKDESDKNSYKDLTPYDMCSISPDILVVCSGMDNIYFCKRIKISPFLKTERIIKNRDTCVTLCSNNDSIFVLYSDLTIVSFTKNGKKIKTIQLQKTWDYFTELKLRFDPTSGNFWISVYNRDFRHHEIASYNTDGEKISFVKKEDDYFDFDLNKFGHIYFVNRGSIFAFLPDKTILRSFKSDQAPKLCVSENKIFAFVQNFSMTSMQIFEICYMK